MLQGFLQPAKAVSDGVAAVRMHALM